MRTRVFWNYIARDEITGGDVSSAPDEYATYYCKINERDRYSYWCGDLDIAEVYEVMLEHGWMLFMTNDAGLGPATYLIFGDWT